jgi:UDP-glucose 4-epimerase
MMQNGGSNLSKLDESRKNTVLVTGGAGYIGSHTTLALLQNGYDVVAVDNFSNSYGTPDGSRSLALERVKDITGKSVTFHKCDLKDKEALDKVFSEVSRGTQSKALAQPVCS